MNQLLLLWMPGPTEWVVIALVLLLLFGGRKIPELMKGLGKGMKEFKDATKDEGSEGTDSKSGSSNSGTPKK